MQTPCLAGWTKGDAASLREGTDPRCWGGQGWIHLTAALRATAARTSAAR
ncbi:hypothetical protein ACQF4J_47890 (plasmid) [Streptomyces sp. C1-1]